MLTYQYNGAGQRVKKKVGTEETIFIYDAMGKSVAEYVLNPTTTPDVRTRYVTQDQLGSPRVITDGVGQVRERHDYLAYGEEATSSLSTVRTTVQKYAGTSAVRKRYTGYERDDESGLDYAQARYYNNAHGRFTSVDPLTASAAIKNPQTFNRYSYALNSPYKFTDPLGLVGETSGSIDPESNPTPQQQEEIRAPLDELAAAVDAFCSTTTQLADGTTVQTTVLLDTDMSEKLVGYLNDAFGKGFQVGSATKNTTGVSVPQTTQTTIGGEGKLGGTFGGQQSPVSVTVEGGVNGSSSTVEGTAAGQAVQKGIDAKNSVDDKAGVLAGILQNTPVTVRNDVSGVTYSNVPMNYEPLLKSLTALGERMLQSGKNHANPTSDRPRPSSIGPPALKLQD
jgi:RHS repeat-associated protein